MRPPDSLVDPKKYLLIAGNSLYEILNTHDLPETPLTGPFDPKTCPVLAQGLCPETVEWLLKIFIPWVENQEVNGGFNPKIIDGLMSSVTAAVIIYLRSGKDRISSSFLTQDSLEMYFSKVRALGGRDNNPTAHKFKFIFINLFNRQSILGEIRRIRGANID